MSLIVLITAVETVFACLDNACASTASQEKSVTSKNAQVEEIAVVMERVYLMDYASVNLGLLVMIVRINSVQRIVTVMEYVMVPMEFADVMMDIQVIPVKINYVREMVNVTVTEYVRMENVYVMKDGHHQIAPRKHVKTHVVAAVSAIMDFVSVDLVLRV